MNYFMPKASRPGQKSWPASDLLISDEDVVELLKEPDIDFYNVAKCLKTMPDLLSFKPQSMINRGFQLNTPVEEEAGSWQTDMRTALTDYG